jgi:DNA repair protein RadC
MNAPKVMSLIAQLDDGTTRPATREEIVEVARDYLSERCRRGARIDNSDTARDFLSLRLGELDHEVFAVIYLDTKNRLLDYQVMFRGTIDKVTVHPREIVKEALKLNAASVILAHPRPSGVSEPSASDELVSGRIKRALDLLEIRLLDHILIAGGNTVSMAERGLI